MTWNRGASIAKGYKAGEILGRHFSIFYLPDDRARGEPQKALEIASELGHYESEGWRLRKNGECFWANIVIDAVYQDGELVGFAKVTKDISRQHEVEERLTRANRTLEVALTHMCQGLVLYDPSGRAILFNKRQEEIPSIASDQLHTGMSVKELMLAFGFSPRRATKMQLGLDSLASRDHLFQSREETMNGGAVRCLNEARMSQESRCRHRRI